MAARVYLKYVFVKLVIVVMNFAAKLRKKTESTQCEATKKEDASCVKVRPLIMRMCEEMFVVFPP